MKLYNIHLPNIFQNQTITILGSFIKFPESTVPLTTKLTLANDIQISKVKKRRDRHNKKLSLTNFNINDLVLLRSHKLSSAIDKNISKLFLLYEGRYKIINVKNKNAYVLEH